MLLRFISNSFHLMTLNEHKKRYRSFISLFILLFVLFYCYFLVHSLLLIFESFIEFEVLLWAVRIVWIVGREFM